MLEEHETRLDEGESHMKVLVNAASKHGATSEIAVELHPEALPGRSEPDG
jgi:hypothetical protein